MIEMARISGYDTALYVQHILKYINPNKFNKKDIPREIFSHKFHLGAIRKEYFSKIKKDASNGNTWRINESQLKKEASRYGLC